MTVIHDYKLVKRIGKGMYGEVWQAHHIHNKKKVAVKIERKSTTNTLKHETIVLRHLKMLRCIPQFRLFCHSSNYNYIVMEILGETIDVYFNNIPIEDRIGEIKWIGVKMLACLREIHENGIIHRDVKPGNFLLSRDKKDIKIIDFGLAKQFITTQNHHKPCIKTSKMIGTLRYISTHVHEGYEPSRRDDVISMVYTIIYLWEKNLPWQGVTDYVNIHKNQIVYELKKTSSVAGLGIDISSRIDDMLEYVYSLTYYDEPDYDYMSFLLKTIDTRE